MPPFLFCVPVACSVPDPAFIPHAPCPLFQQPTTQLSYLIPDIQTPETQTRCDQHSLSSNILVTAPNIKLPLETPRFLHPWPAPWARNPEFGVPFVGKPHVLTLPTCC
jgi:hypothetical protein